MTYNINITVVFDYSEAETLYLSNLKQSSKA